jgi:signal transduction histidine kinase
MVRTTSQPKRKQDRAVVEMTEREKRGLAKQLHEGLLQTLSAASILARVVAMRSRNQAAFPGPEFQRLQDTIDSAIDEARVLIRQLQPPAIEQRGLIAALEDLAGATRAKCAVDFSHNWAPLEQLGSSASIALYRIAQESVRCALQRRNVSKIEVTLTVSPKVLRLEVRDNGRADSRVPGRHPLNGVFLMETHASFVRGELKTARDRRGTVVTCSCQAG